VIIGLDTLHDVESSTFAHRSTIHRTNISRDVFLATGRARDLLVEAFSKLPSLRRVGLRDYEGNGRYREGEKAKWKSYGWSLGADHNLDRVSERYAPPDSMLPLLLFALGEASVAPTNLETFLRRKGLPDCSFDLSSLPSDVTPVLSGLKTLLLSLEDTGPYNHGQDGSTGHHHHLKKFLHRTPLLEHLRCNFSNAAIGPEGFLSWLGATPGATQKAGPAPITLDHLTTLDLGMLRMTSKTLLQVAAKFPTLKALSLWKVVLLCTEERSIDDEPPVGHVWSKFLHKLGEAFQAPEAISDVMIGFAVEKSSTRSHHINNVKFARKVTTDGNGEKQFEDPEYQVSYRKHVGSSVQNWLEDLGNRAFGNRPVYADVYNSEDDDDEDDEIGEDEDDSDEDDEDDDI
jgi:hypothetical protein